jgi:hypothetical protein
MYVDLEDPAGLGHGADEFGGAVKASIALRGERSRYDSLAGLQADDSAK